MTDLTDVVTKATVTSARQNLINEYIQDGTHKINTLSVDIGGTEVIGSNSDVVVVIPDTGNVVGLTVNQNDVTNNPVGATIVNAGTGNGLLIDQNGDGIALNIDSEATSVRSLTVEAINTSTQTVWVRNAGIATDSVMQLVQEHASSTGIGLEVTNNGTGNGLLIDQNGNGIGLNIDGEETTSNVVSVIADTLTTGSAFVLDTDCATFSSNFGLEYIVIENAGATGKALGIKNDGTGTSLFINQNGNGIALNIDNAGTAPNITLTATDVEVIDFDGCTDSGTSHTTLAGSLKIQMPNGSTGYINLYT